MKKYGGYIWYYENGSSPRAWRGVDSMLNFLTKPFGNCYSAYSGLSTASGLKKGDIVFTTTGTSTSPADLNQDVSHVVIVSRDVGADGKIYVCGHTTDQCDVLRTKGAEESIYLHLGDVFYDDFSASSGYSDSQDKATAQLSFGDIDETYRYSSSPSYNEIVKNIQTRLNYLGFSCGTADGKFGANTRTAVKNFQAAFTHSKVELDVDGVVGRQTKEALCYPKSYSR